jgi:hypothetical protein
MDLGAFSARNASTKNWWRFRASALHACINVGGYFSHVATVEKVTNATDSKNLLGINESSKHTLV